MLACNTQISNFHLILLFQIVQTVEILNLQLQYRNKVKTMENNHFGYLLTQISHTLFLDSS